MKIIRPAAGPLHGSLALPGDKSVSHRALILGASSGFGAATALELARSGLDIFGVHLDLRSTLPNAHRVIEGVKAAGREAVFFNVNAADAGKRAATDFWGVLGAPAG